MRKARSLTGLFEWIAVHSDVAEAVSLDRKLYGITKKEGRVWGNEALPEQSSGKLTSLRCKLALPQRAAFGAAKCLFTKRKRHLSVPFSFGEDEWT